MIYHNGRRAVECAIERFAFDAATKIGSNSEYLAALSDTTGNMNKFCQLLEEMHTHCPYFSDYVLHLTWKKLYEDVAYEEGGAASMCIAAVCAKKAWKLVMFLNKCTQEIAKLKLAQQLLSTAHASNRSFSAINVLLQDIVARW